MKRLLSFLLLVSLFCLALPVSAQNKTVDFRLGVEKKLTGDTPDTAETFAFKLTGEDGAPMPREDTLVLTGADTGYFLPVTYTEPADYHYTIREVPGDAEGYTYDPNVYHVTVQVTTDDRGNLTASVYVSKANSDLKAEKIVFVNEYKADTPSDPGHEGGSPQTGDSFSWMTWAALGALSLMGLLGTAVQRSKQSV